MAGYPSNTIQDLSIKFFELAAVLLSSVALTPIQWLKVCAFLAVAAVPWFLYFTARNLWPGDELKGVAGVTALLGTAYWWNSLPREMFFYGMIGFPIACYVALCGVSVFYRMARQSNGWSSTHGAWLVFALLFPSLHVQSALILAPPMVALLFVQPQLLRSQFILWILGAAILSLATNWIWIGPALAHLSDDNSRSIVEQLSLFVSADPLTFLKDYLSSKHYWSFRSTWAEKGLRLALLGLGVMGVVQFLRGKQRTLGLMLAAALVTLFLVTYFGSLSPVLKGWQPLRFKVALDLFFVPAAAYLCATWMAKRGSLTPRRVVPLAACLGAVAFLVNIIATESSRHMLLRTEIRPEMEAIIEWIRKETPAEARVLFEESGDESGFVYDGMYLSSLAAHRTGRQLIGGPINLYNDRHHFAEFHSGKLFKKEVRRLSDEEIRNYFRLYNIGAIVSFHPASIQRLQAIPGFIKLEQRLGPVHLMKVNQPLTWFMEGNGEIRAGINRIRATNVTGSEVVLKYHWIDGLAATPPARIVPIKLLDDPIPFIKIVNPPREFVLSLKN
jgi:hypothetical protein